MAGTANLKAYRREPGGKGNARKLRQEGRVPAVIYGRGEKTRPVALDAREMERLFSHISVENTVIELDVEGERGAIRALVREVQSHPAQGRVLHVDFLQIHAGELITVEVPVHPIGTPAGVRAGGMLQFAIHDIAIRCTPESIPEALDIDVSGLEIGDSVHVADLRVPEGVEIETDGALTVLSVLPPAVVTVAEGEAEPEPVAGKVEPELIRRRGEDEADTAGEE
jgi:large subunit ribosomal protein L25